MVRKRSWLTCFTPIKGESKAGIMADAFNPSVREAEASGVQGYSGLQSEFHMVRPCPKINKQKQMNKQTTAKKKLIGNYEIWYRRYHSVDNLFLSQKDP